MSNKIIIPLPLMTLNQYTNANRTNRHVGAKSKKKATDFCKMYVLKAIHEGFELKELPANFEFIWYCKDRRTDKDNIAFQKKFIFDGMQSAGLIPNDNWEHVGNWIDKFEIDKSFERVEIRQLVQTRKGD